MLEASEIHAKLQVLQRRYRAMDQRWQDARAARKGEFETIAPDLVSEDFPKPIIANQIDVAARDLAEMIAPLPSFNCSSPSMTSDTARKQADKRTKVAQFYVDHSKLDVQMLWGADHYLTYAVSVLYIEPDYETRCPRILIEDPVGGYPEYDRWGRVTSYTKRWYAEADTIANLFPEYADRIVKAAEGTKMWGHENQVELVRYCDAEQIALVLVCEAPVFLSQVSNRLGETPIVVVRKPGLDMMEPRGQWDDVIWVQLARDMLAKLNLEAVEKAVQAPLALPNDVQDLPYGPDAILRTATPEKVRRVGLEMSPAAFQESALLLDEVRQGARYPGVRTGGTDASIITGKGVQALLGGFDSQIKTAQLAFKVGFQDALRLCFKMDEKLWPNTRKEVSGQFAGSPYQVTYTPAKDINGNHSIDVSYGFAAGMDPNRAVVMMLQLRAEKLFSRDYMARQLPFDYDVGEEFTKISVEDAREAMLQSVYGYAQSIPALAQMGMDPGEAVARMAQIVKGLQKGGSVEEVVAEAFTPEPAPPPAASGAEGPPGAEGGPGGVGGGLTDSGLMRGVAPGQAGTAPGGRPDLSVMLAGLTGSGQPSMSAFTMRRRRA
jgi:hypothetical protein